MDDDLNLEDAKRKSSARKGRRAKPKDEKEELTTIASPSLKGKISEQQTTGHSDEAQIDTEFMRSSSTQKKLESDKKDGHAKAPSRRVGGWGNEESSADGGSVSIKQDADDEKDTSENDIPVIPDLEETQEDSMAQVAMAPSATGNRVATYKELDNDLLRHAAFATLGGEIDLKLLVSVLAPEADVTEEDKPWDWDHLFTEICSELTSEWEAKDTPEPPAATVA